MRRPAPRQAVPTDEDPGNTVIYLLHFDRPYKHARHYLGYAKNFKARFVRHMEGRGARLMAAVAKAGIPVAVARKWPKGDRTPERKLHNRNNNSKLCPICNPKLSRHDLDPLGTAVAAVAAVAAVSTGTRMMGSTVV
jgi:hypothetical protein